MESLGNSLIGFIEVHVKEYVFLILFFYLSLFSSFLKLELDPICIPKKVIAEEHQMNIILYFSFPMKKNMNNRNEMLSLKRDIIIMGKE